MKLWRKVSDWCFASVALLRRLVIFDFDSELTSTKGSSVEIH